MLGPAMLKVSTSTELWGLETKYVLQVCLRWITTRSPVLLMEEDIACFFSRLANGKMKKMLDCSSPKDYVQDNLMSK